MIDQLTIDRIMDAAHIEEVVGDFVQLRKRGVNYVGLCPFHDEKTPSFSVSPSKGICKCFSCGKGGNAAHFIMEHEQLSYPEALRYLAKKYNIEIQEKELTAEQTQEQRDREAMFILNGFARDYFADTLFNRPEGQNVGLAYFYERGFRDDILRKFQLGYCLEQRDGFTQSALQKGYAKRYLEDTGLSVFGDNHYMADRFRGRVMFPVHTLSGKVVAFGGRVLKSDAKTAKYVNSPESKIYHKSNELYGLYLAKQQIVKQDTCYLVEGYTDVISMHQAGIENVVASSGTALTPGQIRMIHRFTENITVLYDGDAAGIKASIRGIDLLLHEGMNIKVLLLPNGEDPDSFARSRSASEFAAYIKEHETDFIRFKAGLLMEEAGRDPIKKAALIKDLVQSIALIPSGIKRAVYMKECSTLLEVDEQMLVTEVKKALETANEKAAQIAFQSRQQPAAPPPPPSPSLSPPPPSGMPSSFDDLSIPPPPPPVEGEWGDIPPPLSEADYYPLSEPITQTVPEQRSSLFDQYERDILKYLIRYGEKTLELEQTGVEETEEIGVIAFVQRELSVDDIEFQHPLYRLMYEEMVKRQEDPAFVPQKYFIAHPDAHVSMTAVELISDKYQLSKYHSKFKRIETDEERLSYLVAYHVNLLKDAIIKEEIKEVKQRMKQASERDEFEFCMQLMLELKELDEIKNILARKLGERIVNK